MADKSPVDRGVELLDLFPLQWRHLVHVDVLDVTNPRLTVLGQLFGTHEGGIIAMRLTLPWAYGFDNPHWLDKETDWRALQAAWINELTRVEVEPWVPRV